MSCVLEEHEPESPDQVSAGLVELRVFITRETYLKIEARGARLYKELDCQRSLSELAADTLREALE